MAAGACIGDQEGPGPEAKEIPPGMALIRAAGKSFRQGAKSQPAGVDELPAFESRFTYDFFMDTVEVTQGDYAARMGKGPTLGDYGYGPDHPAYEVSWFDAALYANARSKAEGLDTVYEYQRADRSSAGSAYDLSGLVVHLDRRGYRLPTESEWEYAAAGGTSSAFVWGDAADSAAAGRSAWYAANSGGRTQPVGRLAANAFGLHDMAGNVMEWVGDWKGRYPAEPVVDFGGSRDPGPQAEAPVKGGSFKYGLRDLRISNRSATYPTLRSAAAVYVGFRCVLGPVPKPGFSFPDGGWAVTDPVRLEPIRMGGLVGGRAAKLVFVNVGPRARHLAYIDYAREPVAVREFGDAANVFHPSISPDGEWVAYGTAAEGSVSGSTLYVRRLGGDSAAPLAVGPGFIPRWWVDPAAPDTFLVYATTGADDMQSTWSAGKTLAQRMKGGKPEGTPVGWAQGAFHDGRSRDGRWLATGFRRLLMRDGEAGTVRTLFTAPANGKSPGDTSQVCNVSIAPDSSGRLLFLDFGYDGKSGVTGSWYDIHAVAFLSGPQGEIRGWYKAPPGEKAWDDLEWSNHPRYAVAAATDQAGNHGRLHLLDLTDSASTLLAAGTYLATPALWVGPDPGPINPDLNADSLGRYNEPATNGYQGIFSMRMARFWARHDRLELVVAGSSHAWSGIDPTRFTRLSPLNGSYPTCGWLGQEEWVRGYALPHCPRMKALIVEALPGWMHYPDGDLTWKGQIARTLGVRYDSSHGFWKDGLPAGFEAMAARAPAWNGVEMDSLGTVASPTGAWGEVVLPTDGDFRYEDSACQRVLARMEDFAREIASRRIHLVFVNYPTHPGFKGTPYYGPYGPRNEDAAKIIERLQAMETISPYVHFYDAHRFGNHDYADADAINADHLASTGAAKLTARLDSLINTFIP